jgi:3-oxoacyl-[acyl-carrier protein] reductase
MELGIGGRVALITGATRGIGLGIAEALANEGARVAVVARTAVDVNRVAGTLGGIGVSADLTTESGCRYAVETVVEAAGPIEILVNSLGLRGPGSWSDTTLESIKTTLSGNLGPAATLQQLVLPGMMERGWGRIIIISSIFGFEAGGAPAYSIAKAAEIGFVKSWGVRLVGSGVTVNAVAPGAILYEGGSWFRRRHDHPEAIARFIRQELPRGRFGTVEEVASVVAFLSSTPASGSNGACWVVDGAQSRSALLV